MLHEQNRNLHKHNSKHNRQTQNGLVLSFIYYRGIIDIKHYNTYKQDSPLQHRHVDIF